MNVEYTGRQFEVPPVTRKQVETGLEKIQKILGNNFEAHAILSAEKHRHIAEITVAVSSHPPIVGLAEASQMTVAVGNALDRVERQAVKYKTKWKRKRRQARQRQEKAAPEQVSLAIAVRGEPAPMIPLNVHSFPNTVKYTDAHVGKSADSVSY